MSPGTNRWKRDWQPEALVGGEKGLLSGDTGRIQNDYHLVILDTFLWTSPPKKGGGVTTVTTMSTGCCYTVGSGGDLLRT